MTRILETLSHNGRQNHPRLPPFTEARPQAIVVLPMANRQSNDDAPGSTTIIRSPLKGYITNVIGNATAIGYSEVTNVGTGSDTYFTPEGRATSSIPSKVLLSRESIARLSIHLGIPLPDPPNAAENQFQVSFVTYTRLPMLTWMVDVSPGPSILHIDLEI